MLATYYNRNFGLDIVRSVAILLVLLAHSGIIFVFGINLGFVGVEIFFVLSGFLIGQIILKEFQTKITIQSCGEFYINRWLRTFPLYYLVLITKDFFISRSFHPKHYLFIQQNSDLTFFPVSWSLAIEEWFYILIPLVFIVNIRWLHLKSVFFIALLIIIILTARYYYISNYTLNFDLNVRKSIPLRFDALLTGVLFSVFKMRYNALYIKLAELWSLILSAILFAIALIIYRKYVLLEASVEEGTIKNIFQSLSFTFFSFAFGFIIIWLEQCKINLLNKKSILVKTITLLSVLTYGIYLIHYDIFKFMISSPPLTLSWAGQTFMALFIIIAISLLLHLFIEKPAMDYRKTFIRKLFPAYAK